MANISIVQCFTRNNVTTEIIKFLDDVTMVKLNGQSLMICFDNTCCRHFTSVKQIVLDINGNKVTVNKGTFNWNEKDGIIVKCK